MTQIDGVDSFSDHSVEVELVIRRQNRVAVAQGTALLLIHAFLLLHFYLNLGDQWFFEFFAEGVLGDAVAHLLVVLLDVLFEEFGSLVVEGGSGIGIGEQLR